MDTAIEMMKNLKKQWGKNEKFCLYICVNEATNS